MKPELQAALVQRAGWDELYEAAIPGLTPANDRGERRAKSPFPDVSDSNPSFSVNTKNGLWRCFNSNREGDYVKFYAIMNATEFDPISGRAVEDYTASEKELCALYNVKNAVTPEWITLCAQTLSLGVNLHEWISSIKPWSLELCAQLGIGFEESSGRIVFPVYNRKGALVDARLYRPGGKPKFLWKAGSGANYVWPREAWRDGTSAILCEGEPDTISLRTFGFPATCGTVGCGAPIPDIGFFQQKDIWLCMDDDESGKEALERCLEELHPVAKSLHIVRLPEWPEKPDNADISDLIQYCRLIGYDWQQIQNYLNEIFAASELVELKNAIQPVEDRTFSDAISSLNVGKKIRFNAKIVAKDVKRYILPVQMKVTCPSGGQPNCKRCPMNVNFNGKTTVVHDPASEETFDLIEVKDGRQEAHIKKKLGINQQCTSVTVSPTISVDVQPLLVQETIKEQTGDANRSYRETYVIIDHKSPIEENAEYGLIGSVYSHPDSQLAIFLTERYVPMTEQKFKDVATPELLERMKVFQPAPGQTSYDKCIEVADDIAQAITHIRGRRDLHLAYRSVWHSLVSFEMVGNHVNRGWLEALIIGDTRTGKTATFRAMADFYGLGEVVDCKAQTQAGILGGVEKALTGKFFTVPGVYPRNDNGVVCFDEFRQLSGGGDLLAALQIARSEGVVKLSKIVSTEWRARVRSIWLANPAMGKIISQQGLSGIELIADLIPEPEYISRFDLAMVVRQDDVPRSELTKIQPSHPARYPKDLSRFLLQWAHGIESVMFSPAAIRMITKMADDMCDRYSAAIPLVEPADQVRRIARLAVSVAAQCFSTDDGKRLLVTGDHVDAAGKMFDLWYDHPAMAYSEYTTFTRDMVSSIDFSEIQAYFDSFGAENGRRYASRLMEVESISPVHIGSIVPGGPLVIASDPPITKLQNLGCIRPNDRGRKYGYMKTATFVNFLRQYLSR